MTRKRQPKKPKRTKPKGRPSGGVTWVSDWTVHVLTNPETPVNERFGVVEGLIDDGTELELKFTSFVAKVTGHRKFEDSRGRLYLLVDKPNAEFENIMAQVGIDPEKGVKAPFAELIDRRALMLKPDGDNDDN